MSPGGGDRGYRPRRPSGALPRRSDDTRSNAAVPAALAVLIAGLVLGHYGFLLPALFGFALLAVALSFVSSHLNPFSIAFYLTVKPSWIAIGTLVLVGVLLLGLAYSEFTSGMGAIALAAVP